MINRPGILLVMITTLVDSLTFRIKVKIEVLASLS